MPSGNGSRFVARPIATGGTSTTEWTGWRREFPELNLDECPALVLVAPHPDDETLGFGATAATLRSRGIDVQVVSVTDGGGAFPELSRREREWLASDRRAELQRAIEILGLGDPIHLGLPDGDLGRPRARVGRAARRSARRQGRRGRGVRRHGGETDIPTTNRSGARQPRATERTGAALLEYPIWMWHWADPDDDAVPWQRMSRVRLDRAANARKQRAASVFRTQLTPHEPGADAVLPPFVMRRLLAVGEVVFR